MGGDGLFHCAVNAISATLKSVYKGLCIKRRRVMQEQQLRLHWLPELLSFFARTRQFGVLDRIANALGPDQALAALYDALRIYRSSCTGSNPDKECRPVKTAKEGSETKEVKPEELLEKAKYEVGRVAELLLDRSRAEEGLRLARTAALLALGR